MNRKQDPIQTDRSIVTLIWDVVRGTTVTGVMTISSQFTLLPNIDPYRKLLLNKIISKISELNYNCNSHRNCPQVSSSNGCRLTLPLRISGPTWLQFLSMTTLPVSVICSWWLSWVCGDPLGPTLLTGGCPFRPPSTVVTWWEARKD